MNIIKSGDKFQNNLISIQGNKNSHLSLENISESNIFINEHISLFEIKKNVPFIIY